MMFIIEYKKSNLQLSFINSSNLYFEDFLRNNDDSYYDKIINKNYYHDF